MALTLLVKDVGLGLQLTFVAEHALSSQYLLVLLHVTSVALSLHGCGWGTMHFMNFTSDPRALTSCCTMLPADAWMPTPMVNYRLDVMFALPAITTGITTRDGCRKLCDLTPGCRAVTFQVRCALAVWHNGDWG